VVGESGSGKTTLARMVLRLVEPSSGEITLAGRPLAGRAENRLDDIELRRLVQPIFQNPFEAFSAYLPVEEYLRRTALNLRVAEGGQKVDAVVDEALRSVGLSLERVKGKYIRQFSGGELQRVSVARALIPNPRLIVADEPVSMVDASLRMSIVNLFKEIVEQKGVSFIYITHDLSTAYYLSDQVSIMSKGQVIEKGHPREILAHPSPGLHARAPGRRPGHRGTVARDRGDRPAMAPRRGAPATSRHRTHKQLSDPREDRMQPHGTTRKARRG
jgi:peptide/nickel transport system ATP-binding protein